TIGIGFTFIAVGMATLNLSNELLGLIATFAFGYGLGLVLSGTNLWVAELAPSRRAAALSILNLGWGIGAISCPVLVMVAERNHRLPVLLSGVAGLSLLLALALVIMKLESPSQRTAAETSLRDQPAASVKMAFALGGLFFLYCGTESAVGGWAGALAKRMEASPGNPWELAPMFFWAGLLAGRAMAPMVLRRAPERTVLISGLTLATASSGALVWF